MDKQTIEEIQKVFDSIEKWRAFKQFANLNGSVEDYLFRNNFQGALEQEFDKRFQIYNNFKYIQFYKSAFNKIVWLMPEYANGHDCGIFININIHEGCIYLHNDRTNISNENFIEFLNSPKGNCLTKYLGNTRSRDNTYLLERRMNIDFEELDYSNLESEIQFFLLKNEYQKVIIDKLISFIDELFNDEFLDAWYEINRLYFNK